MPKETLGDVVESVSAGDCAIGLIPLYNTTRLSIEESQRESELVTHIKKVFVTDVLPLDVKHYVGGFGPMAGVREFRSKTVVFHQISEWLEERRLEAVQQVDYPSTSAAVMSLLDGKPAGAAAVGTASAFKNYKVPVLGRKIQNDPNVTLFFVVTNKEPELAAVKQD